MRPSTAVIKSGVSSIDYYSSFFGYDSGEEAAKKIKKYSWLAVDQREVHPYLTLIGTLKVGVLKLINTNKEKTYEVSSSA